jgi:hypothetical protein
VASLPDDAIHQAAELYAATFAGRQDAYAIWSPADQFHRAVRQPLTGDIILTAFETGVPVSGYILATDSTTHLAVLDIDRDDGYVLGQQALRRITGLGGLGYIEASRRGCHLWVVLDRPLPGIVVRSALRQLIVEAGLPRCPGAGRKPVPHPKTNIPSCPGCSRTGASLIQGQTIVDHADPRIELRPGSDHLNNENSVGHCIRMPTMPHQKTGKRYVLVSGDGEKLSGKLVEMMAAVELSPAQVILDLSARSPVPNLGTPPLSLRQPWGAPAQIESACQILISVWGTDPSKTIPGRAICCPAHDDHNPSLSIARDDERVFCKSGACDLYNDGRGRGTHELRAIAAERGLR